MKDAFGVDRGDIAKAFAPKKLPSLGDVGQFKDVLRLKGTQAANWARGPKVTVNGPGTSASTTMGGRIFKPSTTSVTQNPARTSQAAGSKSTVTGPGLNPTYAVKTTGGGLTGKAKLGIGAGAGIGVGGTYAANKRNKNKPKPYYPKY
jgi:hypothetical protein